MPTLAEKPIPMAKDHQGSETGNPDNQCTIRPMLLPKTMPRTPPAGRQECRLDQELPEDLAAPCAERLAHADLPRALGDRDHHDRHHADAADHQRDRGDDDERQERRLADLIPHLQRPRPASRDRNRSAASRLSLWRMRMSARLRASPARACSSRGTTAIIAVRNTAGLKLLAEILAEPLSTLPIELLVGGVTESPRRSSAPLREAARTRPLARVHR